MINLNFICRTNKVGKSGLAPIEVIITSNKQRTYCTLELKTNPKTFEKDLRRKTAISDYCSIVRNDINNVINYMKMNNIELTPLAIKDMYKNGLSKPKPYNIKNMVDDYMRIIGKKYNIDAICQTTYDKYRRLASRIINFFGEETPINNITVGDIEEFKLDIRKTYEKSTASSLLTLTKSFFTFAFNNGKLNVNLFATIKIKKEVKDVEFLTQEELDIIKTKTFATDRLTKVRDCFLFACYTGLAFTDLKQFSKNDILEHDNIFYIKKKRQKTEVTYTTVLNDEAMAILVKYDYQLPLLTNQKYNAYLAEIADICGINKPLHSHIARHTFGTLMLNKGYSLEVVAKMLGHTNVKQTSHYAKLLDKTIINEYKRLG